MAVIAVVVVAAIAATIGVAVWLQWRKDQIAPGEAAPVPVEILVPASRSGDAPDVAGLLARFDQDSRLGDFVGQVTDVQTGQVLYSRGADRPLRPASLTKLVTGLAAVSVLPLSETVSTQVLRDAAEPGTVYLVGGGDVWIDEEAIADLAEIIVSGVPGSLVTRVIVDTSAWAGFPAWQPSWNPEDVAGGFIAPMEPLMMGVSPTPAFDVARAVADQVADLQQVSRETISVEYGAVPAGEGVTVTVGSHPSDPLIDRLTQTIEHSNNIGAEALARETVLALMAASVGGDTGDSASRTIDPATYPSVLLETVAPYVAAAGDVTTGATGDAGVVLFDASGMSPDNRLTAGFVDGLLQAAAQDSRLSQLLFALPVGGGVGTLDERMEGTPAQGWVRAKTGTLDGTSGLAGTVTAVDGSVFTFAFLSNGSNVLEAREALDEMASVLRALG